MTEGDVPVKNSKLLIISTLAIIFFPIFAIGIMADGSSIPEGPPADNFWERVIFVSIIFLILEAFNLYLAVKNKKWLMTVPTFLIGIFCLVGYGVASFLGICATLIFIQFIVALFYVTKNKLAAS